MTASDADRARNADVAERALAAHQRSHTIERACICGWNFPLGHDDSLLLIHQADEIGRALADAQPQAADTTLTDEWDDIDSDLLYASTVEAVAWSLLDQTSDLADRGPSPAAWNDATASAERWLAARHAQTADTGHTADRETLDRVRALADEWESATCITDGAPCSFHRHAAGYAADLRAALGQADQQDGA